MEKIEKKENHLLEILQTRKAKYVVGTLLLSGIGIALPRIFHILAGSSAGATFLPMHIAVLIAALTFGALSASIVGGTSVVCSYLLTGMPTLTRLPYMAIELVIYAVLLGILNKKFNSYISLIATIILGRVIYAGVLFVAINVIGLQTYGISVIESIKTGLPGIVFQLVCIPFIAKLLNERLNLKND
ncbi:MAG: ECF transporter S component [Clostridia bacterium]|mgnify:FL=1|nr:ECF transporter S component [Clostridia bacterium]